MVDYIIQNIWIIATIMIFATGIYFSIKLRFIHLNIKRMINAIKQKRTRADSISAFQALTMSLAERIGVGSLAGIALSVYLGGPGVLFWIWITSFLCAGLAYAESILAVVFRKKDSGNIYRGGPFYYIREGMGKKGLALIYAGIILVSYIGGFLAIQVNTVSKCVSSLFSVNPLMTGIFFALFAGMIILGGVKKIADVTSKLVPLMTGLYFLICFYIIFSNVTLIPDILKSIFESSLNFKALGMGFIGTMLIGMQKGIFSSEVGLGTGSISAATADVKSASESRPSPNIWNTY